MTSELKPGEYIQEFVSGGPKNYAYKVVNSMAWEEDSVQRQENNLELQRFASVKFWCD